MDADHPLRPPTRDLHLLYHRSARLTQVSTQTPRLKVLRQHHRGHSPHPHFQSCNPHGRCALAECLAPRRNIVCWTHRVHPPCHVLFLYPQANQADCEVQASIRKRAQQSGPTRTKAHLHHPSADTDRRSRRRQMSPASSRDRKDFLAHLSLEPLCLPCCSPTLVVHPLIPYHRSTYLGHGTDKP